MEAAKLYCVDIVSVPKSKAGANAKAPAVYLNNKVITEIGFLKKGAISLKELINVLNAAGVPERPKAGKSSCSID